MLGMALAFECPRSASSWQCRCRAWLGTGVVRVL